MCDKEENDMTTAEAVKEIPKKSIPSSRIPHISKALSEVEQIEKGTLRSKSARAFLKELREEK